MARNGRKMAICELCFSYKIEKLHMTKIVFYVKVFDQIKI